MLDEWRKMKIKTIRIEMKMSNYICLGLEEAIETLSEKIFEEFKSLAIPGDEIQCSVTVEGGSYVK